MQNPQVTRGPSYRHAPSDSYQRTSFLLPPQHSPVMPNQHKPCRLFFRVFFLTNSSQIELVAPLALIESDIRRFHSQGVSLTKMVHLLKKHYDTDIYGIG